MRRHSLLLLVAGALLLPSAAAAQQPQFWQPTLESARRVAAQTNRLVLVYFCADWCQTCRAMEQDVFGQPAVTADLQSLFVPVKVNASYFPATARQYGVVALPTTVVMTPDGQAVESMQGRFEPSEYVTRLRGVAAVARRQAPAIPAAIAAASGPAGMPPTSAPSPVSGNPPQAASLPANDRFAGSYDQRAATTSAPAGLPPAGAPADGSGPQLSPGFPPPATPGPTQASPQATSVPPGPAAPALSGPPAATPQSENPPLALEGYCPVCLLEKQQWVLGDRRWGARHRGRTYLFSGPQERDRFFADPDRFAPMLSGNDVVLAVERGQFVSGYRQHGVFFGNRVYLFADETSLQKFSQNPGHYANQVLQAMRADGPAAQQMR